MIDAPTPSMLTVMSYNIGNGLASPARLARFLQETGADVVGLQEVDRAQAITVDRDTAELYPYRVLLGTGFTGRGLLSRYPIVEQEWVELSAGRPDLRVRIDIGRRSVAVVVAHTPPPRLRRQGIVFDTETFTQIERLAALVSGSAPAILVGDFNMTPRHPCHAQLVAAGLVDAHIAAGVGRGATFPLRPGRMRRVDHRMNWVPLPPVARVDYIWHTGDLETLGSWIGKRGAGSDHRPVLARLALGEAAATSSVD